jgi:hypothetical protein
MSRNLDLRTNRDLYLFITKLWPKDAPVERSLEDYLRTLWQLGAAQREHEAVPLPAFAGMLEAALHEPPPPFDPSWASPVVAGVDAGTDADELAGFARWDATIREQIVDLHEMEQAGTFANEQRYFGTSSPRGSQWFNFDPRTFLECAMAGRFGGWCGGDDTGRICVPGECVMGDEDGS